MNKGPERIPPDPRWQNMIGTWKDLQQLASEWPVSDTVPQHINAMLQTARDLFVQHYFVYEFGAVSVVWSLLALEAALRDRFSVEEDKERRLVDLIAEARDCRWIRDNDDQLLDAGRQLRNRFVHAHKQAVLTPGLVAGMLQTTQDLIVRLYSSDHGDDK